VHYRQRSRGALQVEKSLSSRVAGELPLYRRTPVAGRSVGRLNGSVESGASHAKSGGDLGNGDICRFEQGTDRLYLFGGEFGGASSIATAGARRLETGYRSFADQVALELKLLLRTAIG
jgi:hypothetical protein